MQVDYLVIGAGSAGCAVAARLSEDDGVQVALLEAGGRDDDDVIRIPANFGDLFETERDWNYRTVPTAGPRRAPRIHPAWEAARRLQLDERDGLPARPPKRLRRLGGGG